MIFDVHEWARRHGVAGVALKELLKGLDPIELDRGTKHDQSEAAVQAGIRMAAARFGAGMWRNNNGACQDETGRYIRFGLGNDSKKLNEVWKSSDLIGITPMMSTAPGQIFGVFTAVECKDSKFVVPRSRREIAQSNFHNTVRAMGGLAMFATSVQQYEGMFNGPT